MFFFTGNDTPLRVYPCEVSISGEGRLTIIVCGKSSTSRDQIPHKNGQLALGPVVAAFVVSSNILTMISAEFNDMYFASNWDSSTDVCAYVELDSQFIFPMEIFLRAIHDRPVDIVYSVNAEEASHTLEIAELFGTDKSKLKFWFSHWLAANDFVHMNPSLLPNLKDLCSRVNHTYGLICINKLLQLNSDPYFPQAISHYPPVLAKSYSQLSASIFHSREIKPSGYRSTTYSPSFLHHYGKPTSYYTDFHRLLLTPTSHNLSPNISSLQNLTKMHFLSFAKAVDNTLVQKGLAETRTVWRDEMEAMWVKMAVRLFEREVEEKGGDFEGVERIRLGMQGDLKGVVRARFYPIGKVERYWREKADLYGGAESDILKKGDGYDEPDGEMELALPELGEGDLDMKVVRELIDELRVRTESGKLRGEEIEAAEVMVRAKQLLLKGS